MTLKKNFVLAVVVAVICALIFKVEIPRDEQIQKEALLFPNMTKASFDKIEMNGQEGALAISRTPEATGEEVTPSSWRIEGEEWTEVNAGTVDTLLNTLLTLKTDASIPEAETESDLSLYGLSKPETTLKVTAKGKVTDIHLGKMNKYVAKRYLQIEGNPKVFLITDSLSGAVNHEKREFRNTKPISFSDPDIRDITIVRKQDTIKVASEDGDWKLVSPLKAGGSKGDIEALLASLHSVTSYYFLPSSEKEKLGLDKPDVTVTINFKAADRAPLVVAFKAVPGEEVPNSVKGGKPLRGVDAAVFTVEGKPGVFKSIENITPKYLVTVDSLREKNLFKFDTYEVQGIDLKYGTNGPISVKREEGEWTVDGEKGDKAFLDQLAHDLAELKAEGFPKSTQRNDSEYGFDKPTATITVKLRTAVAAAGEATGKAEDVERILYIGRQLPSSAKKKKESAPDTPSQYYAAVGDRSEPFTISQDSYKKISPRKETLVKIEAASPPTPPK